MRQMKDKLTKTGHKGIYYRMKRLSLFSVVLFTLGVAVAIPTYYSAYKAAEQQTSAEVQKEENPSKNQDQNSNENDPDNNQD